MPSHLIVRVLRHYTFEHARNEFAFLPPFWRSSDGKRRGYQLEKKHV